jgi:uncharacterized protein YdeI (BOF family)
VVGTYFIDFSGDEPDFTESGDSYVSKTARLEVKDAEPLAAGATASFYIAMKPFTAPVGSTLKVQVYAGAEVSESELALTNAVSFQANHIKKLNVEYAPEAVEGKTLAEALALADNTDVTLVPLTVGAVSTKGYVVTDGTDGLYVYVNSTPSVKVGDVVKVTGKMASYYGVRQVASPSQTVVTDGDGTFEVLHGKNRRTGSDAAHDRNFNGICRSFRSFRIAAVDYFDAAAESGGAVDIALLDEGGEDGTDAVRRRNLEMVADFADRRRHAIFLGILLDVFQDLFLTGG